jgi:hypothetical protein
VPPRLPPSHRPRGGPRRPARLLVPLPAPRRAAARADLPPPGSPKSRGPRCPCPAA